MNFYPQIFLEALHRATIIPFTGETAIYAMKAFGTYPMAAPVLLALIGATLGHLFNWYVGRILLYYQHKGKLRVAPHHYERARTLFNGYGIFLLLFVWAPLLDFVVVLAGFLNISVKKALPLIVTGVAAHYAFELLL